MRNFYLCYDGAMSLVVCGINHKSAPLRVREKLVFNPEHTSDALSDLLNREAVNEAVLLSTCNRTEVYAITHQGSTILDWIAQQPQLSELDISHYCYAHQGIAMVKHMMRVASGLDSVVLGEPQIFGQIKRAYMLA